MSLKANTATITLNNGVVIPAVGLGTWQADKNHEAYDAVKIALENGYRHIDTASIYGNEEDVGRAIQDLGVPRKEIFVTTKLWNTDHNNVSGALQASLERLKLDYVDLYLMHWPAPLEPETEEPLHNHDFIDTYKRLEEVADTSAVRAIGVSNFTLNRLQRLLADRDVTIKPVVNQIETHPLLPQTQLINYMKDHQIQVEAYSPLGSTDSPLIKNEDVKKIAEKYDANPGQVLISWAVQRGTIVLPKSVTESRIISNLNTFTLSDEDFATLNQLSDKHGVVRTNDPGIINFDE